MAGLDTDIGRVQKAFEAYFASEAKLYWATNCSVFARCCGRLNHPELGLPMIAQAFAAMEETGEEMTASESWRIKGNLLLLEAGAENSVGKRQGLENDADFCLRKAVEVARQQKARSWELRAALSLSRRLVNSGRTAEARTIITEIYSWFTEGLHTPDLVEAQGLLVDASLNNRQAGGDISH